MSLMGVDVGTTGVKAAVFDEGGSLLCTAYEEYPLLFPFPSASELDSHRVIEASFRVIAKAAGEVKQSDLVKAIGFASQGEAFTPVTQNGEVLGNAMTSSDGRAESYVRDCSDERSQRLYDITGHTRYPMYSLFKLMWLKEHQPEIWNSAWKFLFCQDLIAFTLTGEAATDYSMAARSMLFDVERKVWSDEILQTLDLEANRLPKPLPSGTIFAKVRPQITAELNLGPDVGVAVCGHDQPVGALGCGAASPGSAAYSIGTVECITPSVERLILKPELMAANLASYPHVLPETYTTVAFNITGGSVLKWIRDNIATEEAAEAAREGHDPYDVIIAAASSEPANIVLLPHFGPTGTPHFDSEGVGAFFGLTLSTTRAELFRSVLEGITFEMKWNLSILEESGFALSDLRAVGGGAKSDVWMQIKADILQTPLTTMRVAEATCMGAAILAGSGMGLFDAKQISKDWAKTIRTFEPSDNGPGHGCPGPSEALMAPDVDVRGHLASAYEERFEIYKELYNSLRTARHRLHQLKGR